MPVGRLGIGVVFIIKSKISHPLNINNPPKKVVYSGYQPLPPRLLYIIRNVFTLPRENHPDKKSSRGEGYFGNQGSNSCCATK
jgi:hypothetical protein